MATPHQTVDPCVEGPSAVLADRSLPCEGPEAGEEAAVRAYLDRVCAPLAGKVPEERRVELRRELGQHLEALADAHEELGEPRETALARALEDFGSPERVGREWLAAWRQGTPPPAAAHALSLACFLLSSGAGCTLQIRTAVEAGLSPAEAWLAGPIVPVLAGLALCQAHRAWPWVTRLGLAGIPLLGMAVVSRISLSPGVSAPAIAALTAMSWGILGAATAGVGIHTEAWLSRRIARSATR